MKRIILTLLILKTLPLFALPYEPYEHSNFDMYRPKANHGDLIELELSQMSDVLGLNETTIKRRPDVIVDDLDTDYKGIYRSLRQLIPKAFYEQRIDELNQQIFRVLYQPVYTSDEIAVAFSYERIFVKDANDSQARLRFEGFLSYQEYGWQSGVPEIYGNSMLMIRNNSFDGVMVYRVRYQTIYGSPEDFYGSNMNTHNGYVYYFSDDNDHRQAFVEEADIRIDASWPLLESNDHLFKYTIQNAFDQNPATSYVEDTEDDLMEVVCFTSDSFIPSDKRQVTGIRLINGNASNIDLYKKNNRIKSIRVFFSPEHSIGEKFTIGDSVFLYEGHETNDFILDPSYHKIGHYLDIPLMDNYLKYQTIDIEESIVGKTLPLLVSSINEGQENMDTCLAEFDIKFSDNWIFRSQHSE